DADPVTFQGCSGRLVTASSDHTLKVWDLSPAGVAEVLTAPGWHVGPMTNDRLLSIYQPEGGDIVILDWRLPPWSSASGQPVPTAALSTYHLPGALGTLVVKIFDPPTMGQPWMTVANVASWLLSVQSDGSVEILDASQQGKVIHAFCC